MRSSRLFILITALAGSINAQTNSTPVTGVGQQLYLNGCIDC